jgi:hypothetical protein
MNRRVDRRPLPETGGVTRLDVPPTRIDPHAQRGWWPWSLLLGVLLLVALAIIKPWQNDDPTVRAVIATPTPTPSSLSADALAIARCHEPNGWRAYAWEVWHGQTIRHFIALDPLAAPAIDGSRDARIPVVPLLAEAITAIGYCASTNDPGPSVPGATVQIWQVGATGQTSAPPAVRIEPVESSGQMALFAYRDSGRPGQRPAWPSARYLFAISGPPGSDWHRWFALEVVDFRTFSIP